MAHKSEIIQLDSDDDESLESVPKKAGHRQSSRQQTTGAVAPGKNRFDQYSAKPKCDNNVTIRPARVVSGNQKQLETSPQKPQSLGSPAKSLPKEVFQSPLSSSAKKSKFFSSPDAQHVNGSQTSKDQSSSIVKQLLTGSGAESPAEREPPHPVIKPEAMRAVRGKTGLSVSAVPPPTDAPRTAADTAKASPVEKIGKDSRMPEDPQQPVSPQSHYVQPSRTSHEGKSAKPDLAATVPGKESKACKPTSVSAQAKQVSAVSSDSKVLTISHQKDSPSRFGAIASELPANSTNPAKNPRQPGKPKEKHPAKGMSESKKDKKDKAETAHGDWEVFSDESQGHQGAQPHSLSLPISTQIIPDSDGAVSSETKKSKGLVSSAMRRDAQPLCGDSVNAKTRSTTKPAIENATATDVVSGQRKSCTTNKEVRSEAPQKQSPKASPVSSKKVVEQSNSRRQQDSHTDRSESNTDSSESSRATDDYDPKQESDKGKKRKQHQNGKTFKRLKTKIEEELDPPSLPDELKDYDEDRRAALPVDGADVPANRDPLEPAKPSGMSPLTAIDLRDLSAEDLLNFPIADVKAMMPNLACTIEQLEKMTEKERIVEYNFELFNVNNANRKKAGSKSMRWAQETQCENRNHRPPTTESCSPIQLSPGVTPLKDKAEERRVHSSSPMNVTSLPLIAREAARDSPDSDPDEDRDMRIAIWEPPPSPYSLIEEMLYNDPWRLLTACMLLNKTNGKQVRKIMWELFKLCPTPEAGREADTAQVEDIIKPLGLHRKRAVIFKRFCQEYLEKEWRDPQQLHGIGQYAADAYYMFCRGKWKHRPAPQDKDLLLYYKFLKETDGEGQGFEREVFTDNPITPTKHQRS